ncbi:hypothetical protein DXX76_014875 [Escherichia coli]|nr:hypothetical protein DXX76_014875 [Escherichia coli]
MRKSSSADRRATWLLDASKLALNITIPQIYLNNAVNGYISPSRWDQGSMP